MISDNKRPPHLYEQYNITAWFRSPLSHLRSGVRLYNSFVDGLNASDKLLKYVVIISEKEFITGLKHLDYGVVCMLDEHVNWLFKSLTKTIKCRRDDILSKRAGALGSSFEPRLIFVTMIECPPARSIKLKKIMGLRDCFNSMLTNMVTANKYTYILDPDLPTNNVQYFDQQTCELSETG